MGYIKTAVVTGLAFVISASAYWSTQAMPVDASIGHLPQRSLQLTPVSEGLFENGTPDVLKSAWDNTYIIIGTTQTFSTWGTAFPVIKKRIGNKNLILMLSAGHVTEDLAKIDVKKGDSIVMALDTWMDLSPAEAPTKYIGKLDFKIEKILPNVALDAAAILISVPDSQMSKITPLTFSQNGCEATTGTRNFVIGFPLVTQRPVANQNVSMAQPEVVTKRWSEGFQTTALAVDPYQKESTRAVPLAGSTADGLQGNSGSPVLDANGNLIGLFDAIVDTAHFKGDETTRPMQSFSFIAPCADLQEFTFTAWESLTH